jgi:serine/threonine protein kinase
MEKDPAKRISAEEAMNHAWIKTHTKLPPKNSKFLKEPAHGVENVKKLKEYKS